MKNTAITGAVLTICCFAFCSDLDHTAGKSALNSENNKNHNSQTDPTDVTIREKWDLPGDLKEISGLAYIDNKRFACVQDELGTIFIYNTASARIEKQIDFAGRGDFEGIAVNGNMAYVVRADGHVFEVNMNEGTKSARDYGTHLTEEQNLEGVCFDKNKNRLLVVIKGDEAGNKNYKGIYAFDLTTKTMATEPVFKIELGNSIFNAAESKKRKSIMPSDIAMHPGNGDIYIADGPAARLLIMDQSGRMKALYNLGKKFAQPEGITFSGDGQLFISNEGSKQSGNIMQVEIQR